MIIRMWLGRVASSDSLTYRGFLNRRALPDYRSVPGNVSVQVLERLDCDVTHFMTLTMLESLEAIRGFAGENIESAKYYPEDKDVLLELEPTVFHYEVVGRS